MAAVGCGDDELPCHELGYPYYCESALGLALRTTQSLTPSTEEVHSYYRRLQPVYAREPILALVEVDNNYFYLAPTFGVWSAYPPLVSAWSAGERHSDDPLVDAILADAPSELTISVIAGENDPPGYTFFWLETHSGALPISWRVMTDRLATIPETMPGGMETPGNGMDVLYSHVGDDDVFDFNLGWGDCEVACINVHRWTATVHANGAVDVDDLGGAAIEQWQYDMASQLPPLPDP